MALNGPPAAVRVLMAGYMRLLTWDPLKDHPPVLSTAGLEPWLLHLFFINALLLIIGPGVWWPAAFDHCICQVEALVQYFCILWCMPAHGPFMATHAILYMAWHIGRSSTVPVDRRRRWVQYPEVVLFFLVSYCFVVVPLVWLQSGRGALSHEEFAVGLLSSTLACDASIVIVQGVSRAMSAS